MFFKISLEQVGITFFDDKAVEDLCLDIIEKIERRTINHFLKNKNIAKKFNFEESTPKNKQLEQYIKTNYKVQENCTEIEKLAAYIQEYIQLKIETNDDLNDPNNQNITKPNQVKNDDNDQNDNASFANNKQNATLEKFNKQITDIMHGAKRALDNPKITWEKASFFQKSIFLLTIIAIPATPVFIYKKYKK